MIRYEELASEAITAFSKRDLAYITDPAQFQSYLSALPDFDHVPGRIESKNNSYTADQRQALCNLIKLQYAETKLDPAMQAALNRLQDPQCFTVTTAHQPCIMGGPLYFILKIATIIAYAAELKTRYPTHDFVPLFVIGSEDHDFEEINHLHLYGKTYSWEATHAKEVVGRMSLENIQSLRESLLPLFQRAPFGQETMLLIDQVLQSEQSLTQSTRRLLLELFGSYGLLMVDLDSPSMKAPMIPIFEQELTDQICQQTVPHTQSQIEEMGYKPQAHCRAVNLFYINESNQRYRIKFHASNTTYEIADEILEQTQLLQLLHKHPERFSPNVILRPVYQECCLPNVIYVGGGAEVAYWMELHALFARLNIPFPILARRKSAAYLSQRLYGYVEDMQLSAVQLFGGQEALTKAYLATQADARFSLVEAYEKQATQALTHLKLDLKGKNDSRITSIIDAQIKENEKFIDKLCKSLRKAQKTTSEVELKRLEKVHKSLFPEDKLQERWTNFLEFYAQEGPKFIDGMIEEIRLHPSPDQFSFGVIA